MPLSFRAFALLRCVLVLGAILALLPLSALAQKPSQDEPYEDAIRLALSEFDAGNFAEAREHFRKAHSLDPNARTLRALGLVEFELRNYGEAANFFEQSLKSAIKPLNDKQRADTEKLLERTRGYLGTVHLATTPAQATIVVDGATVELGPSGTLVLEVGEHVFEFHADGHLPAKQRVSIKGGQTETLRVTLRHALDPISVAQAAEGEGSGAATPASGASRVDKPLYKKWWVWTATGVAVVAGVVTTAVLVTRDGKTESEGVMSPNTPSGATIQSLIQGAR